MACYIEEGTEAESVWECCAEGDIGTERDEVTWEWRKLHNLELYALHCSPNITGVIQSRRMRWAGHVAWKGSGDVHAGFWWGNLREREHLKDLGVSGSVILRWTFRKWDGDKNRIDMAQDRNSWRALLNAVMNVRIP